MKLLLTGATGGVGSHTLAELDTAGIDCDIVATDVRNRLERPIDWHYLNLLDARAVTQALAGVDAVVHLGNHTGAGAPRRRSHQTTFSENVAMNYNVFHGAAEAGVGKIIFASSMQVVASEANWPADPPHAYRVAYLPLDAESPPNPTNSYALSKRVGEELLDQFYRHMGIQCIALRLPLLCYHENLSDISALLDPDDDPKLARIAQGFSYLSYRDAARAIVAGLITDLPGYRAYLPAISGVFGTAVRPVIEKHYPDVPLKHPIDQIEQLVDHSHLTSDTGWEPVDSIRGG